MRKEESGGKERISEERRKEESGGKERTREERNGEQWKGKRKVDCVMHYFQ